jgi:hypothetical protein
VIFHGNVARDTMKASINQLSEQLGGFMTVAKTQRNPQPLCLDISNANLHITPEQFDRFVYR